MVGRRSCGLRFLACSLKAGFGWSVGRSCGSWQLMASTPPDRGPWCPQGVIKNVTQIRSLIFHLKLFSIRPSFTSCGGPDESISHAFLLQVMAHLALSKSNGNGLFTKPYSDPIKADPFSDCCKMSLFPFRSAHFDCPIQSSSADWPFLIKVTAKDRNCRLTAVRNFAQITVWMREGVCSVASSFPPTRNSELHFEILEVGLVNLCVLYPECVHYCRSN